MDGSDSELCPVAGFGISDIELSSSTTSALVSKKVYPRFYVSSFRMSNQLCISFVRFNSVSGQAGSGSPIVQPFRVATPITVPQPVPVTLNRHVPVAVPQPYTVTVPKPYPVAVPHPVTVSVPRPYPVSVPRPVPVPVPHPVPVAVPHPVGVPVPKPYPVPVPHPVPVPSSVLFDASAGGIPFGGLGGELLNFGHGAGHGSIALLALAEGHSLNNEYGYGLSASGFSPVPQIPLPSPNFETSSSGDSAVGNTPGAGYSNQEDHNRTPPVEVPGGGLASSLSYVENGNAGQPLPPVVVPPSPSPALPVPSGQSYPYGPGYKQ